MGEKEIDICIKYEGVRHIGKLHYVQLVFDIEHFDYPSSLLDIIGEKRELDPLTEKNIKENAEYLIKNLRPSSSKPIMFLDFDTKVILASEEEEPSKLRDYWKHHGELLKYKTVSQEKIDKAVLFADIILL